MLADAALGQKGDILDLSVNVSFSPES